MGFEGLRRGVGSRRKGKKWADALIMCAFRALMAKASFRAMMWRWVCWFMVGGCGK